MGRWGDGEMGSHINNFPRPRCIATPYSLLPAPYSLLPAPCSLNVAL
ncbi:MAG: hypothetical protein F6J90_14440 [Moorea sp. SIOASIH]|nr:hypothetical protein [Moorena sp. SIOASIH]NEO37459.1 hypothetical protein [Moorena sp. SIOASIH]